MNLEQKLLDDLNEAHQEVQKLGLSLMFVLISDVSDNENDSDDEENNQNSRNGRNNAEGIKGQKKIKDCFISLDTLKMEKGGDIKSNTKTQKVLN